MNEHDDAANGLDLAPGDAPSASAMSAVQSYLVGLALAALLTLASFLLPMTGLIWPPGLPVALAVLAIAQMGVHLVFFLHITSAPDSTNNVLALAFGVLVVALVIGGSIWIMEHLNHNMMPDAALQPRA